MELLDQISLSEETIEQVEPHSLLRLEKAAERAVQDYCTRLSGVLIRTDATLFEALSKLLALCQFLEEEPEAKTSFFKHHKITSHGLVRNPHQPVIKCFLKGQHREARATICKAAGAIGLAVIKKVEPDGFRQFVRDQGGINKAAREYSREARPNDQQRRDEAKEHRAKINQYLLAPSQVYAMNPHTSGRRGRQVLIADVEEDGSFVVRRVVDFDPVQVDQFILGRQRRIGQEQTDPADARAS